MKEILKLDHIQKYYGNGGNVTKAIQDISFSVQEGEFVGIMGASGSGKTTLLNCISTIDTVSAGHIYLDGTDVTEINEKQIARFRRENLGFVFQDFNLLDTLTISENIALALTINKVPAGEIDGRVREMAGKLNIMDILDKHKIHVTFFMTGGWVESYPDDVKMIAERGHDLGNHSQNHKQMSKLSLEECKQEIQSVHDKVKEITGKEMILFRPPYGDYNDTLITATEECGYHAIQWDVDSLDWKDYGVDSIIKTVCEHKHLGNGSIILCHNGAKYTADALDTLITTLQEKGYEFVPISQLIYPDSTEIDTEGRQHSAR